MKTKDGEFRLTYGLAEGRSPALIFPFVGDRLLVQTDFSLPHNAMLESLGPWQEALVF
jgi:hypothetical protein